VYNRIVPTNLGFPRDEPLKLGDQTMIRFLTLLLAVVAIGIGAGTLTWGITSAAMGDPIRSPIDYFDIGFAISTPSEAIGWGAGFLAGGFTALILGLALGRRKRSRSD
jgi:hypothetical protein